MRKKARGNMPEDVRIAVPWFKPERNETDLTPDYYLKETAEWLVFPHELDALTPGEMAVARPQVHELIERVRASQRN